jgi:hypothetical protein
MLQVTKETLVADSASTWGLRFNSRLWPTGTGTSASYM